MKLHTGDTVVVISGKDKGKVGRILRTLEAKRRVVVAGVNMRTRHMKKTQQAPGRIIRYEAALDVSNIMLVDPKTKKRTRIGVRKIDGKKERFARGSGEALVSGKKLKKLVEEETKAGKETNEAKETKEVKSEKKKSTTKKKKS
jgi:large subunit ribosomal protein L24